MSDADDDSGTGTGTADGNTGNTANGSTGIRARSRPTGPCTGTGTDPGTGRGLDHASDDGERDAVDMVLDHEKLIVYRVAREFVAAVNDLLPRKMPRDLHDQLDRSTMSILSNIGEGAGKTARAEKRRFYEIARGSATEASTQLDLLQIKRVVSVEEYRRVRHLVVRVIQMLSRMCLGPRAT